MHGCTGLASPGTWACRPARGLVGSKCPAGTLASAPSTWTVGGVGLLLKPRPVDASRRSNLVLVSLGRMQAAGSPSS